MLESVTVTLLFIFIAFGFIKSVKRLVSEAAALVEIGVYALLESMTSFF